MADQQLIPKSILDKPLQIKGRQETTLSFLAFLFAEIVRWALAGVRQSHQLEEKLHELGVRVGYKALELLLFKEKHGKKRETRLLNILTFISQNTWRYFFGHSAELLKGQDRDNECRWKCTKFVHHGYCIADMLSDRKIPIVKYINVPSDVGHVSCAAFVAGIVEGMLCSSEFPAEVTAHSVEDVGRVPSTTILIRFLPEVIQREKGY